MLEIASAAAKNSDSVVVQPNKFPSPWPAQPIVDIETSAVSPAIGSTLMSRAMLNSSPTQNMTSTTPNSDSAWTRSTSANSGKGV